MKKVLVFLLMLFVFQVSAFADDYVRGYTRRDGTYVEGYHRSSPDGNPYNNYNYPGNTNPYTGEVASGNPNTYLSNYYDNNDNSGFGTSSRRRSGSLGGY